MNRECIDFVIAGVQKGGTTALDAYLRQHPELCMASRKETHFFDTDAYFQPEPVDYAAYHAFFQPGPRQRLCGEATPIYLYWQDAVRRMWRYHPGLKIIVILRNPISRAFSHWNMERDRKMETLPFGEALRAEVERCRAALPEQHRVFSYVDRGFYLEQLRRLWRYFPREQTLILRYEVLRDEPQATLDAVCRFLGVTGLPNVMRREVHARPYATAMTGAEWEDLRAVFEWEIRGLESVLGWDCQAWLKPPTG